MLGAAPEIVLLAENKKVAVDFAAHAYFAMGALIGLDQLRALAGQIVSADHWDRLALRRIVDDLYMAQRLLTAEALQRCIRNRGSAMARPRCAHGRNCVKTTSSKSRISSPSSNAAGEPSIAKLSLANSQIQKVAATE